MCTANLIPSNQYRNSFELIFPSKRQFPEGPTTCLRRHSLSADIAASWYQYIHRSSVFTREQREQKVASSARPDDLAPRFCRQPTAASPAKALGDRSNGRALKTVGNHEPFALPTHQRFVDCYRRARVIPTGEGPAESGRRRIEGAKYRLYSYTSQSLPPQSPTTHRGSVL
jgi:hypothetical protein